MKRPADSTEAQRLRISLRGKKNEKEGFNSYYYIFNYKNEPDVYRTRGSMQEVCKMLSEFAFERCSACYLVNLRHVVSVANNEIVLRGGVTLPISRKFLKIFTDSFMKFLGGNGTINA